jgi:signal transduction histidine kinase
MRENAAEMLESKAIQFDFHATLEKPIWLTLEQRKNIYLIFKEIIHNIAKHSHAQQVSIKLEAGNYFKLNIQDDGVGIKPALTLRGNGLDNLEKRTSEILGTIKISSSPSQGTTINLTVPLT